MRNTLTWLEVAKNVKHVMSSASVNYLADGAQKKLRNFSNPGSKSIGREKSDQLIS